MIPVLERCAKAGVRKLVITATSITDRAIGLLVQNNRANTIHTLVVRTPRVAESDQGTAIEDIAVLTGGRVFYSAAQADFTDFQIADLGYARRAWATQSLFGLFGGTAILRVADATDAGSTARKTLALRAVTTLRHALSGGVVAGGEVALRHAQQAVAQLPAADADEAMAYKILHRALEEPLRTITQNAGYYPTTIINR